LSTSTVCGSRHLVPWLAADGLLAYSPAEPPSKDYFFQYSYTIHDRVVRSETECLRHASGLSNEIAESAGLDIANESEVKIVDPTRISLVEGHGCAVQFTAPTE
jgi:hypothetical protein